MILATALAGILVLGGPSGPPVSPAPKFATVDIKKAPVSSADFRGKSTVMFVFCACRECRLVAEEWTRRAGKTGPQTFVAYAGRADDVKRMAKMWPGKGDSTRFLVDPDYKIAESYRALPCPAAFVVDGKGLLRYSSKVSAGKLETDAKLIVGQVFDTLADVKSGRAVTPAPTTTTDDSSPLVAVVGSGSERTDDRSLRQVVEAPTSAQETTIERVYQFKNPSKKPVRIDQVLGSCGCSDVGLLVGKDFVAAATIAPGQTARVRVRMTVPPNFEGQKTVQVWVMAKGGSAPLGRIEIELRGAS